MSLDKIKLDESKKLSFGLEISGTDQIPSQVSLLVKSNEGFNLSFPATLINTTAEVDIPKLENVIRPGVYEAFLEVILEDRYLVAVKDNLEFSQELRAKGTIADSNKIPDVKIDVSAALEKSKKQSGMSLEDIKSLLKWSKEKKATALFKKRSDWYITISAGNKVENFMIDSSQDVKEISKEFNLDI